MPQDLKVNWNPAAVDLQNRIGLFANRLPINLAGVTDLVFTNLFLEGLNFTGCDDLINVSFTAYNGRLDGAQILISGNSIANIKIDAIGSCTAISSNGGLGIEIDLPGMAIYSPTQSIQTISLASLSTVATDFELSQFPSLISINAPALLEVDGNLTLSFNSALTSLDLPTLNIVGASVSLGNCNSLATISLAALQFINANFDASNNNSLLTIDLGELITVAGTFGFAANTSLQSIALGNLTSAGDINGSNTLALSDFIAPNLSAVGSGVGFLLGGSGIASFNVPGLASVNGDLFLGNDVNLTTANFSALSSVAGNFDLSGCTSLGSLTFPQNLFVQASFNLTNCSSLTDLTCDGNLVVEFGDFILTGCASLQTITVTGSASFGDTGLGSVNAANNTALTSVTFVGSFSLLGANFDFSGCTSLTTWAFASGIGQANSDPVFTWNGCALDQTSVDGIIQAMFDCAMAAALGTASVVDLSGGTNAPPSAGQSGNLTFLAGYGVTVFHN